MELTENKLKQRVQRNILTVSVLILVGKFIAYYLTNSVGVLTDAMESIVNVVAGAISLFSLCLSEKPKDQPPMSMIPLLRLIFWLTHIPFCR